MNYQQIIDWTKLNWVQAGLILLVFILLTAKWIKTKKEKKKAKEEAKLDVPPEPPKEYQKEEEIDFDTIGKFLDMNLIENTNLENLKALKKDTKEEIKTLQDQYEKARTDFQKLLKLEQRLKIHIQTLIQQEMMYDEQIKRLSKKG